MPLRFKRPKFLSRLFSLSKDRGSNEHSRIQSSQSIFRGAHHIHMGDLRVLNAPNATHVNVVNEAGMQQTADNIERGRLDTLPKHPDMSGKRGEYLPNSRQPDVEKLCEQESSSTDLVLCIHGPAGIGKSTLAGHLSDEFRSAGRLAASIFLGAFPTDASGPETIIKMIAHEIGSIHPRAIPKIVEAMDQCHGTSLENHLQKYILEPLQSLNHPQPLIIIIDAMDEWRDRATFIRSLALLNSQSSIVKFILTDRLNPCASHLPGVDAVSIYTYALGPISKEVIRAYFDKSLKTVPWVDGRKAHPADIEKLTELSGGLPVWAATVIKLLSHSFSESPPHEILSEIVGSRRQVGGGDGLGELYCNALMRLFPTSDVQKHFRRYIAAIIILQEALSLYDFSTLVGIPSHLIKSIQHALSAVQTRPPPPGSEKMVHPATVLFHLSFLEYLQATTTETSFAVSAFDSHSALGLASLKQLVSLPSPSPHRNPALRAIQHYAVKHWLYHVSNGTPRSNDQWSRTEHCSTLQNIPAVTQQQWATLFLQSLMPGDEDEFSLETEDGMELILRKLADCLDKSGGDHWGFQVACLEIAVRIDDGDAEGWSDLGRCYHARGHRTGNLQMHEEAVVAFRHALQLWPDPHPNRAGSLYNVALALWSYYQHNGNHDRLGEAISCSRMAVTLCPAPHPDRDRYLHILANTLHDLYSHNGDLQILNEVISLRHGVLALHPVPHPSRSDSLNNLANALCDLYEHDGNIDVLNEAISLWRESLALCPASHPYRSTSLDNLAGALNVLYRSNCDDKALNEAISLYHEALALRPAPHPDRSDSLHNLACSLKARYQRNGDISTLNECISLYREALALRPGTHPDRPDSLANLANALLSQFEQDGVVEVLDEAISFRRELMVLQPPGHRFRADNAERLLVLLERRREVTGDDRDGGEIEDLEAEMAALDAERESEQEDTDDLEDSSSE